MPKDPIAFTREALRTLRNEIIKLRQKIDQNTGGRVLHNAGELYYCKTPTDGIPAATEATGVITCGKARCQTYNIRNDKIKIGDKKIGVYNRHKTIVFGDEDFLAIRDGFGNFFVAPDWYNQIRMAKAAAAIVSGNSGTVEIYTNATTDSGDTVTGYHEWCHSSIDVADNDQLRVHYDRNAERWELIDRECPAA